MVVLGVYGAIGWDPTGVSQSNPDDWWVHASNATLVIDGKLKGSAQEERFNRYKYYGGTPLLSINALLDKNNIKKKEVDFVAFVDNCSAIMRHYLKHGIIKYILKSLFPNAEIGLVRHHTAHMAAAFLTSGYDKSTVITNDGAGSSHQLHIGSSLHDIIQNFTYSLCEKTNNGGVNFTVCKTGLGAPAKHFMMGIVYDEIGKKSLKIKQPDKDYISGQYSCTVPGKVMGLSAYGSDTNIKYNYTDVYHMFNMDNESIPEICIDIEKMDYFAKYTLNEAITAEDLAYVNQKLIEHTFDKFLTLTPSQYKLDKLCFGGGVALNVLNNSNIINKGHFQEMYVNSAPGDEGLSQGAALYAAQQLGETIELPANIATIGIEYTDSEIENTLHQSREKIDIVKLDDAQIFEFTANVIYENKIVGWFQGKSEYGPRALGNRSILANPSYSNKDVLNQKVKFREEWRPYAASVLESEVHEWFDLPVKKSPYMMFSGVVKPTKVKKIPSVTHIDHTCRVQTVSENENEKYFKLLHNFYQISGIPLILNTSFNTIPGEPIVESPEDALRSFLYSNIDYLVIGNYLVTKKDNHGN